MKQIKDNSQFAIEFQKLIDSKPFINMMISEEENRMVIRLEKQPDSDLYEGCKCLRKQQAF